MNNDINRELYYRLLSESIRSAKFNKLTIESIGECRVGMTLDGEPHGLIGALTTAIQAISEGSGIPVELILQMIASYNECLQLERIQCKDIHEDKDISSLLDLFGNYVKNVKEENKEGEK